MYGIFTYIYPLNYPNVDYVNRPYIECLDKSLRIFKTTNKRISQPAKEPLDGAASRVSAKEKWHQQQGPELPSKWTTASPARAQKALGWKLVNG